MRSERSLNGNDWWMGAAAPGGSAPPGEWLPARVPGNVRPELARAGRIPEPFFADNNEHSRWVDGREWWFRKEFDAPEKPGRAFLRFMGLDYHARIELNGKTLGEHVGMFSPVVLEATRHLKVKNTLIIHFQPASRYPDRLKTLKCQMSYGWDFAPTIRTVGIWDDVSLLRTGNVRISRLSVHPRPAKEGYSLDITVEVDSLEKLPGVVQLDIEGDNFSLEPIVKRELIKLKEGPQHFHTRIQIDEPRLWEPWEEGNQWLYRLRATVSAANRLEDVEEIRFGLRSVEMSANEDGGGRPWTFVINGKRKFIRGANWVPCDSFPGNITADRYRALLRMAKDAGINLLRVWGGGLREKRAFYDLCDEMGIMVWQEFPFACNHKFSYPKTNDFRNLVKSEITGIARFLHSHPSVVYLSGGNEISYRWNRPLFNMIGQICMEESGDIPYIPHSPAEGEAHNWAVHHCLANIADYREETSQFLSEFGLQAAPAVESLKKFLPANRLWPVRPALPYGLFEVASAGLDIWKRLPKRTADRRTAENSRLWYYHHAQLYKTFRYAKIRGFHDLETFIEASQEAQAFGLQVAVEHMRRRRYKSSGVIFWQLNEPWPAICWSVIDYYLKPKKAYHKISRVMQPVLVSLDYPLRKYKPGDTFNAEIFIVNDLHSPLENAELTINIGTETEKKEILKTPIKNIPPDSLHSLNTLEIKLPESADLRLECALKTEKGTFLNDYDLTFHDPYPTPALLKAGLEIITGYMWK
ncbi:MAG: hypothetical protein ABIH66_14170 [bacterium]